MRPPEELAVPPILGDRREGGRWTPLQSVKNHLLYAGARSLLALLRLVPAGALPVLGRRLGSLLHSLGVGRAQAEQNLARVFEDLPSDERNRLGRAVYAELGTYLGESVAQLFHPEALSPLPFEVGSREALVAAAGEGRGVIFASAHLGPWERVAGSLVRHGFPLTTLARESYDPRFLSLYERLRRGVGVGVIYRGDSRAPLRIVRALQRGDVLGMPMDLASRVASVDVDFLGSPARTAVGPARIALRTGAPMVVGTAVAHGDGLALALRVTPIETGDLTRDEAGERELTRRVNEELSRRIRAFPQGWVWMHPRWGKSERPPCPASSGPSGLTKFSSEAERPS